MHLGVSLFTRSRRRGTLELGRLCLAGGCRYTHAADVEMELRVRRTSAGNIRNLRVSFVASATSGLVPAMVLALKKQYPELKNVPTVQQVEGVRSDVP